MDLKDLRSRKSFNPAHPLTNFEVQKYYQNKPRFNGVYFRDSIPDKIKDEAHVINLNEYSNIGSHCLLIYLRSQQIFIQYKNMIQ